MSDQTIGAFFLGVGVGGLVILAIWALTAWRDRWYQARYEDVVRGWTAE